MQCRNTDRCHEVKRHHKSSQVHFTMTMCVKPPSDPVVQYVHDMHCVHAAYRHNISSEKHPAFYTWRSVCLSMYTKVGESSQSEARRALPQSPAPPHHHVVLLLEEESTGRKSQISWQGCSPGNLLERGGTGVGVLESVEQPYEPIRSFISEQRRAGEPKQVIRSNRENGNQGRGICSCCLLVLR